MSNIEKLSGEDLLKKLIAFDDIAENDGEGIRSQIGHAELDEDVWGEFEQVDEGGGMDEGSGAYSVIYFKVHDVYVRIDGYYASHYGYDWDNDPYLVIPKDKTITVYE